MADNPRVAHRVRSGAAAQKSGDQRVLGFFKRKHEALEVSRLNADPRQALEDRLIRVENGENRPIRSTVGHQPFNGALRAVRGVAVMELKFLEQVEFCFSGRLRGSDDGQRFPRRHRSLLRGPAGGSTSHDGCLGFRPSAQLRTQRLILRHQLFVRP